MKKHLVLPVLTLVSSFSFCQTNNTPQIKWDKFYGNVIADYHPSSSDYSLDHGYFFLGGISADGDIFHGTHGSNFDSFIIKVDSSGNLQWVKVFGGTDWDFGRVVRHTSDGGCIIGSETNSIDGDVVGYHGGINGYYDFWVLKLDAGGNIQWSTCYGDSANDVIQSIEQTNDGGFLIGGLKGSTLNYWIIKTDSLGIIQWQREYGGMSFNYCKKVIQSSDGNFVAAGYVSGPGGDVTGYIGQYDFWVFKFDINGTILWQKCLGGSSEDKAYSVIESDDHGFVVSGTTISTDGNAISNHGGMDMLVVKLDSIGNIVWQHCFGGSSEDFMNCSVKDDNGSYLFSGYTQSNDFDVTNNQGTADIWIVKLNDSGLLEWQKCVGGTDYERNGIMDFNGDYNGNICHRPGSKEFALFAHTDSYNSFATMWAICLVEPTVQGNVFNDLNQNGIMDVSEAGLGNIHLTINPGNIIVTTSPSGNWYLDFLPDGIYSITIDTTQAAWGLSTPLTQNFSIINGNGIGSSFGIFYNFLCAKPVVSMYHSKLRGCSIQTYTVMIENRPIATDNLRNYYLDLTLDPLLNFFYSSNPNTQIASNKYRFAFTDSLLIGQSKSFTIKFNIPCNVLIGQNICSKVELFPVDTCMLVNTLNGNSCTTAWDHSNLTISGTCRNSDTAYFVIRNTAFAGIGDMQCYSHFRVFVDGAIVHLDSLRLNGGDSLAYSYFADGHTIRMEVDQHPLHPGQSTPNATVELCGNVSNWNSSYFSALPMDDRDPVKDIDCGHIKYSFDPNEKEAIPSGTGLDHFIQPNQEIQYIIYFQNTGTDTAYTVVIRDTLNANLSPLTVRSGVSSHRYTFRIIGSNLLEWTFDRIMLPDSNVNRNGSNGYVTFKVAQNPNLSNGTFITNNAAIYFDTNPPVITNQTFLTVNDQINLINSITSVSFELNNLTFYPNPSTGEIHLISKNQLNNSFYTISDISGRIILSGNYSTGESINLKVLASGLYIIKMNSEIGRILKQ